MTPRSQSEAEREAVQVYADLNNRATTHKHEWPRRLRIGAT